MRSIYQSAAVFTRPNDTTAYANLDQVANSTTAGSVTPMAFSMPVTGILLHRVRLVLSSATPTNAKFKLHLYGSSPTVGGGDNAAWSTTSSDYLGLSAEIDASGQTFTDKVTGLISFATYPLAIVPVSIPVVYGLLMATAAFTPTAQSTFTVTLLGETL